MPAATPPYAETVRVGSLRGNSSALDPVAFPTRATLTGNAELGRLNVDPLFGLAGPYNLSLTWRNQTGYSSLVAYGGRSFSIWEADTGALVWDSGEQIEAALLAHPDAKNGFNTNRCGAGPGLAAGSFAAARTALTPPTRFLCPLRAGT